MVVTWKPSAASEKGPSDKPVAMGNGNGQEETWLLPPSVKELSCAVDVRGKLPAPVEATSARGLRWRPTPDTVIRAGARL